MRVGLLLVVVLVASLAAAPLSAADGEGCAGSPSSRVRGHFGNVVARSEGADSFTINPRFSCAEVIFLYNGEFPADKPNVDVPDSTITMHQVAVVGDETLETWFNYTIPDTAPLGTFGVGIQPWFSSAPVEIGWNLTGVGQFEFSYRGYP